MSYESRDTDLLSVEHLSVSIGEIPLLADVSFDVRKGEVVGLVGESGSGKTLTGLSVVRLLPDKAEVQGKVRFEGSDLLSLTDEEMRRVRGRRISMIFQEPRASLHPARSVGNQFVDIAKAHGRVSASVAKERACDLLAGVGLAHPRRILDSHTHELSGGMCQRVMIAMALMGEPSLLIADEPTTALDVTIQAQIMELLHGLARDRGLSVLLVSHNLGVVTNLCSRVVTMYCGEVVNVDATGQLLRRPQHPYTRGLIHASRLIVGDAAVGAEVSGPPANPAAPPIGCRFHPRCPFRVEACLERTPPLGSGANGSLSRCIRTQELELPGVLG